MMSMHRFLANIDLLRGLDEPTREQVMAELQPITLRGGQLLFHQGEIGDCLYIVANGRLRVTHEREDGTKEIVGEVGRGETVGEMALITNEPRSSTVRAARDSELYKLSAGAFNRMLERSPQVTMHLARQIVTRYLGTMHGHGPAVSSSSIALVPVHRGAALSVVSQRLARALSSIGTVMRLNSDVVDAALGPEAAQRPPDHARAGEVLAWLYDQEAAHQFVIYEADLVPSVWSQRCVRHGDRLLIVANADDGDRGPVEANPYITSSGVSPDSKELLLLHRQSRPVYAGTAGWLARREVSALHHVALDNDADMDRLARFVTGRATGVVLGGGGARSFAHIGVLRAIEEAHVPIDAIGGASMGAYVAAQYALGWDTERMRAYNAETWRRIKPMQDYTLPTLSLLTGRGFRAVARDICGDTAIEDLGRRFFCVSTNLTRASVNVHQHRGSLWRSILASISVPGLLPPVCEGGQLFVDGAILDNVPVDAMRRICQGAVIASDVSPAEDLATDPEVGLARQGWRGLFKMRRGSRRERKDPTIVDVLLRVSTVSSAIAVETMAKQASLYLRPPTKPFSVVDWKRVDEMVDAGYEYARSVVAQWLSQQADGTQAGARPWRWRMTVAERSPAMSPVPTASRPRSG
jgi:predicted acylesterase/phospholipase RssA/CRP-like cAMP-binding protein